MSQDKQKQKYQLGIQEIHRFEEGLIEKWEKEKTYHVHYHTKNASSKPKYYVLVMFPYPSGKIHMGHIRNYSLGDTLSRYKRLRGFQVLHPIGWDSFGLPAENAAIKHNVAPSEWTSSNINAMRSQLKRMGFSYDWDREIATCLENYYHWNQYIFLKFLEKGWAYRKEAWVNWCSKCDTVLANEQVVGGACWRHSEEKVKKKKLAQWFFRITEFAEELLQGHEELKDNWPGRVLSMQKNWIGKSQGAFIYFKISSNRTLKVFTTRADTIYGATYLAVAPEHSILSEEPIDPKYKKKIREFCEKVLSMPEIDRENPDLKEGVFTGLEAEHPLLPKKIPIYAANFVLPQYGTGAVMSVPAHDTRDFEFAQKYDLPVIQVIVSHQDGSVKEPLKEAFTEDGFLIHSEEYTGLSSREARQKITRHLSDNDLGEEKTQYRIRDWLISRQRYWGTPIPVVYCDTCGVVPVREEDLPIPLPQDANFSGSTKPLAARKDFLNVECPKCQSKAIRETDTMDTFVDSSWYFLRYLSPHEKNALINQQEADHFMPVDQCIGGIEHANMHLLYARYFTRALNRLNIIRQKEPFTKLLTQGMVLKEGKAMSKSLGNVVDPDELIAKYGADTIRVFSLFAAPPEKDLEWSEFAVEGSFRMIRRLYCFVEKLRDRLERPGFSFVTRPPEIEPSDEPDFKLMQQTYLTIKNVTGDMERLSYNTCIAYLMEMLNFYYLHYFDFDPEESHSSDINQKKGQAFDSKTIQTLSFSVSSFLILFSPFAPFISLELLTRMGLINEEQLEWPEVQEKYLVKDRMLIVIQINGKVRDQLEVEASVTQDKDKIVESALSQEKIIHHLQGRSIQRSIYVPQKLVNFVV